MAVYLTKYNCGNSEYGSHIKASSRKEAEKLTIIRGLKEEILGTCINHKLEIMPKTAFLYKKKKYIECLHTLSFVGNILCNAGFLNKNDLLNDKGLIHEIVHEMQFIGDDDFDLIIDQKYLHNKLKEFDLKAKKVGF